MCQGMEPGNLFQFQPLGLSTFPWECEAWAHLCLRMGRKGPPVHLVFCAMLVLAKEDIPSFWVTLSNSR